VRSSSSSGVSTLYDNSTSASAACTCSRQTKPIKRPLHVRLLTMHLRRRAYQVHDSKSELTLQPPRTSSLPASE
jgi:hypothetical protein